MLRTPQHLKDILFHKIVVSLEENITKIEAATWFKDVAPCLKMVLETNKEQHDDYKHFVEICYVIENHQVCLQMLELEENYLRILHLLVDLYKNPLEELVGTADELLNRKEIAIIFSLIPEFVEVHTKVRDQLNKSIDKWFWINYATYDKEKRLELAYLRYINGYDVSYWTLQACIHTRPKFRAFLKRVESDPKCRKESLQYMLIRPIQHIPRILRLLQNLVEKGEKLRKPYMLFFNICASRELSILKKILKKAGRWQTRKDIYCRPVETCYQIENLPCSFIRRYEQQLFQSIEVTVLGAKGFLPKCQGRTITLFLFNEFIVVAERQGTTTNTDSNRSLASSRIAYSPSFRYETERKPYKFITDVSFMSVVGSVKVIRSHGVFAVSLLNIRKDRPHDEVVFFLQLANGNSLENGIVFLEKVKSQRQIFSTVVGVCLEKTAIEEIKSWRDTRPEDYKAFIAALSWACRPTNHNDKISQIRHVISNVSSDRQHFIHQVLSQLHSSVITKHPDVISSYWHNELGRIESSFTDFCVEEFALADSWHCSYLDDFRAFIAVLMLATQQFLFTSIKSECRDIIEATFKDICLEELTMEQIESWHVSCPEDYKAFTAALSLVYRPPPSDGTFVLQLRHKIFNVSLSLRRVTYRLRYILDRFIRNRKIYKN